MYGILSEIMSTITHPCFRAVYLHPVLIALILNYEFLTSFSRKNLPHVLVSMMRSTYILARLPQGNVCSLSASFLLVIMFICNVNNFIFESRKSRSTAGARMFTASPFQLWSRNVGSLVIPVLAQYDHWSTASG